MSTDNVSLRELYDRAAGHCHSGNAWEFELNFVREVLKEVIDTIDSVSPEDSTKIIVALHNKFPDIGVLTK